MELFVNELSLHGQFADPSGFRAAIGRVMETRQVAKTYGRDLRCHRNLVNASVAPDVPLSRAVRDLTPNERRALMQWLTSLGPFWDDSRWHTSDDYLECNGGIVTDTAVGEAAFCRLRGADRQLFSLTPSDWQLSPVSVTLHSADGRTELAEVLNYWEAREVGVALHHAAPPIQSWEDLASRVTARFSHLVIASNAFYPLAGVPFIKSAADRIEVLLGVLDSFRTCFDESGRRTPEGQRLYQDHFTGDNAWFSDSSDSEGNEFHNELTFQHPARANETLFCPWHGKVRTGVLRIHFTWPVTVADPLYVVYVGPKITKR